MMAFCPKCGASIGSEMRFCPNCGNTLVTAASTYTGNSGSSSANNSDKSIYRVILLNLGSCSRAKARECLTEYINYSVSDANNIMDSLPAEVACNLTMIQAKALAKVLSDFGMQVAVCDEKDYVNLNNSSTSSNTNSDNNNVWAGVLGVLATLGIANRVSRISRWNRPYTHRHIWGYRPMPPPPPRPRPMPHPPMGGFGFGGPRPPMGGRPGGFGGGRPGGFGGGPGGRPGGGFGGGPGGHGPGGR